MTIQEMHYEFKRRYERLDSQQRRRLLRQEIDLALNNAQLVFVKRIHSKQLQGISAGQRDLSDIRTLIIPDQSQPISEDTVAFADDHMYFRRAIVRASKEACESEKSFRVYVEQHDDLHEENIFSQSSFEWEEINAELVNSGLKLYPSDFTVDECFITYIKTPRRMYLATQPYRLPSGTLLSGTQDCELPEHVHTEVVDLAVTLARANETASLTSRQIVENLNNN